MEPSINFPSNVNQDELGVRYGVINGNTLPDWIWDKVEYRYPTPWDCSHSETCDCGNEISVNKDTNWIDTITCEHCGNEINLEMPDMEAIELFIDTTDLQLSYDPNSNTAVIFKSSNIVNCRLCSPCYPNAGNLDQIDETGYETYGLPK